MKTVSVTASRSYQVHIGEGLLSKLGQYTRTISKPCKAAIISESNVWPLYGDQATKSLQAAGYTVVHYIFPAGESSKNPAVYLDILNWLAEQQITRSDLLIALGGGVVGDMTGFAAATYLRGTTYIQVPTTLLAMVDSSVGGKTAIDLPAGKNLVGAFWQPAMVLCDPCCLDTLAENVFRDGCAEVIKYGILYDQVLFSHLQEYGLNFHRENVIGRCVELKRNVVAEDEFDRGNRQKLNLGHTIGHGIEACSNFAISHGYAVAAGIGIVSRAAVQNQHCTKDVCDQILDVLKKFNLPTGTDFTAEDLHKWTLSDKKRTGNLINLIIPANIADCRIIPTDTKDLLTFIAAGL